MGWEDTGRIEKICAIIKCNNDRHKEQNTDHIRENNGKNVERQLDDGEPIKTPVDFAAWC